MQYIQDYINIVEKGIVRTCEEQKLLVKYVKQVFEEQELYIDEEKVEKYFSYQKYFPFELFAWEKFVFVLHNCTFDAEGSPRWPDLLAVMGRGAGKNGYLAFEDFCLVTNTCGINQYHIDICATSEDQAKTTFDDIHSVLENPKWIKKFKKHFRWNLTQIKNLKTGSIIKFRTNNAKGKDGLRSGKVDFDEIHAYENWDNIKVFTTGLGKKPHPRKTYVSTNGDVRDGPLDKLLDKARKILRGEILDNGLLPFLCNLDFDEEVHDSKNWEKANPSLPFLPDLMKEMKKEYADYVEDPIIHSAFMTKRMNRPQGNKDIEVTSWENILKTNREVPDLEGYDCVAGIDYTKTTDFMSAVLLFKKDNIRYSIQHHWLCTECNDIGRIKYPLKEAVAQGILTMVDDVEISPEIIANWLDEMSCVYNIKKIAIDSFRYSLLSRALNDIGYSAKEKTIKLVRPSDIMFVQPKIHSWFATGKIIWGDDSLMRWFTNNTKLEPAPNNNYKYAKIEPKSRKTDGFMAFVAAATLEEELEEYEDYPLYIPPSYY